ncbi:MAG: carbamoyltransferase HypF [Armatimonadota bacterium]
MTDSRAIIEVNGIVQGVGFRPFVHQRVRLYGLKGWVLNSRQGVQMEVEGASEDVRRFVDDLETQPPVLAAIERVHVQHAEPVGYEAFEIRRSEERPADSETAEDRICFVSPDVATCEDCLRELLDPGDRRHRYPFTNCTNCGPRFTIVEDTPYDRDKTTMRAFPMCDDCHGEYGDIEDRRYHAQPNACWRCGPQLTLELPGSPPAEGDAITATQRILADGGIVAVKGLGGFHLACDAENAAAVRRLRARKHREEKPLAIMCGAAEAAERICDTGESERRLLTDPRRPIVLLRKRPDCPIAEQVAPGNRYHGVMLPYTPLHALLFQDAPYTALVMTSGNLSEEPLTHTNEGARRGLLPMADALLAHNRDIHARCDDSVARIAAGGPLVMRRSRGYAPFPVRLGEATPMILACGAELKNTFCLVRDGYAFISQHIGDLKNAKASAYFEEEIQHYQELFRSDPEIVAHDLHPQYLSTRYALGHCCSTKIAVQHHHAHMASCMAEHGIREPVIGVSFDGLGLGADDTVWGGEFLVGDLVQFRRAGHFATVPMPGGDAATEQPWRMALSYLLAAFGDDYRTLPLALNERIDDERHEVVAHMIERQFNSPLTSSCGRLFDAVAALVGLRGEVRFEGQAAMELEMHCADDVSAGYDFAIVEPDEGADEPLLLDWRPAFRGMVDDLVSGIDSPVIAARFHNALVTATAAMCSALSERTGLRKVTLSGGCFQNVRLLDGLVPALKQRGLDPYTQHLVPPNDGGISLGQAAVAHARTAATTGNAPTYKEEVGRCA